MTDLPAVRELDRRSGGKPHLLAGVEVDILTDGRLDLPEEELRRLDLVVAAVHSHLADPAERMTARVERAIRSGAVHVLGHPSGRQIGNLRYGVWVARRGWLTRQDVLKTLPLPELRRRPGRRARPAAASRAR